MKLGPTMKTKNTILAVIVILTFGTLSLQAQIPTFDWAFNIGVGGNVYTRSMILDDVGNIYTIGSFNWGPIDFDPGPDSLNFTSAGETDIYVSKFDASGDFIWAKRFGGTDDDDGSSIAVDDSGNIYFTGYFKDVADFDPGPGVYNLSSSGGSEIFVCKLDANGNLLWAKQMGSTSADDGAGIAVDAAGNVYVTGSFEQTLTFNTNAGIGNLTSNGRHDIFICKFDELGVIQWVKQIGSTEQDYGAEIAIDDASNLFLTGSFSGTVDFDPGTGVNNLMSPTSDNCFILKLNTSGNFVWATQLALPDPVDGSAITLDALGNIYVAGGGYGTAISKLNANGNIMWSKFLPGLNDWASSIAVDASGNVYVTGYFRGTVDFDPGPNSVIFNSSNADDSYIIKFDASGNYVWAYQIGEPGFDEYGAAIALDASGNIYSYGSFRYTVDFDPGPNTFNLSAYSYDSYLLKWNQTTVGIEEKARVVGVSIYPNPTTGNFAIKFKTIQKELSVRVVSITGQTVETRTFQNTDFIQLQLNQPNGIYIVEVLNEKGNRTGFRLIKK